MQSCVGKPLQDLALSEIYTLIEQKTGKTICLELLEDLAGTTNLYPLLYDLNCILDIENIYEILARLNIKWWQKVIDDSTVTESELESSFKIMEDLGIVGLSFYSENFVADTVKEMDFSQNESKIKESATSKFNEIIGMLLVDLESKSKLKNIGELVVM